MKGHLVIIRDVEGKELKGNWAGLRRKLGITQYMNADKTAEVFKTLGWEVVSQAGSPAEKALLSSSSPEAEIVELAKSQAPTQDSTTYGVKSDRLAEYLGEDLNESDAQAPDLNPDTRKKFQGQTQIIESTTQLTIPNVNPDYVHRDCDDIIARVLDNLKDEYLYIFGGAGTGKTESIKQYAAIKKTSFTRISMDETMSLQYLIGRLWFADNQVVYKEGVLVKAIQQPGVILLDEANSILPSRTFLLHQLTDSGSIYIAEADKYYYVHPDCRIVFAGNYQSGAYAGVQKMNEAFKSRLTCFEMPSLSPKVVKFKTVKGDERTRFVKFYEETEQMIESKSAKVQVSLRNILRYDKLRGAGFGVELAIRMAILDAIKYVDSDLGEELEALAKTHLDDLYQSVDGQKSEQEPVQQDD